MKEEKKKARQRRAKMLRMDEVPAITVTYREANGLNIILNPSKFSDSSGGKAVGTPSNGFPSTFTVKTTGGYPLFIPTAASGSDSTYSCDYWYFDSSYPCLSVGGNNGQSANYGMFYVDSYSVSDTYSSIGCRLQELPNG